MFQSEKNFFERIASHIPGLKGYGEKEDRRDTDKRLREFMAAEVDRQRKSLEGVKRDWLSKGKLDLLDDADRVGRKLQKTADGLRYASYGYAGFFDQVKVQDAELDKIYAYDSELLAAVRALEGAIVGLGSAADSMAALAALESAVEDLNGRIDGRKQIFNTPE